MMRHFLLPFFLLLSGLAFSQSKKLTTVVQRGHGEAVKAVAISPDGNYVATGSRDKTIKLWDRATGLEVKSFLGHAHTVNDLAFSADGKWLLSSSADFTARFWSVETGEELWCSEKFKNYVTTVAIDPTGRFFAVGGFFDEVKVYDVVTYLEVQTIEADPDRSVGYGVDLAFSPDGKFLAIGEDNRKAHVYSTEDWSEKYLFKPENGWCGGCGTLVAFSPDSKSLVKFSHRTDVVSYDLATGQKGKSFMRTEEDMAGISFSLDGSKLVVATEDSAKVFSWPNGDLLGELDKQGKGFTDVIATNEQLFLGNADGTTGIWSLDGMQAEGALSGLLNRRDKGGVDYDLGNYWQHHLAKRVKYKFPVLLTKDGKQMLTGKTGTKVKLWEVGKASMPQEFLGHEKAVLSMALSKDEQLLATASGDGEIRLWDMKTRQKVRSFLEHNKYPVFDLKFSPDGKRLASCGWDGKIILWDVATGEPLSIVRLDQASGYELAFSPNGLYLVVAQLDKRLVLYEADSGEEVKTFVGHTAEVTAIDFHPNGQEFLTASLDGTVAVWNLGTGLLERKIREKEAFYSAFYAQEGNRIFTAGSSRQIKVFDANNAKFLYQLEGHQNEVVALDLSEEKSLLVSVDVDGVMKFWDLNRNEEVFEYVQLGSDEWMAINTEGYFYATPNARQAVHFVDGMKVYQSDQFFDSFFRPDLLKEAIDKAKGPRRGMRGLLYQSPPPEVKLAGMATEGKDSVDLFVKIIEHGGGIRHFQLFHNGKRLTQGLEDLKLEKEGKGEFVYSCRLPLVAGHNVFSAKASSKGNISSALANIDVLSDSKVSGSKCHLLVIGVDVYENPRLNLNYAKADALAFADTLQEGASLYADLVVHQLTDKDANREKILQKLDDLSTLVGINDVFILYYAGHGSVVDNRFYMVPSNATRLYEGTSMERNAISAQVLQDKLKNIKALKQLIIMDACQSGKSLEEFAQRGALEEKAIAQLSRSAGIHILASAGSEQFASEFPALGHGLFTYALLEALSGKADGAPKDGKVTIYELKSYLDDQVPALGEQYKGSPQYPFTFSQGQDFPVVLQSR